MNSRTTGQSAQHYESLQWFDSSLGQAVTRVETEASARLVPENYFRVCVQVEGPSRLQYFIGKESLVQCKVALQPDRQIEHSIVGEGEWLPFESDSIDFLVLPHALEFSEYPHEVLREVSQCVTSNGVLLITGFNPRGMLSLMKKFNRLESLMPGGVQFHPVRRIRDWLTLSGFEVVAGEFAFFRPPAKTANRLRKLEKFEIAGARWWPAMGSVYVLASRKRDLGIRIKPNFSSLKFRQRRFGLEC